MPHAATAPATTAPGERSIAQPTAPPSRILVVTDHALLGEALTALLGDQRALRVFGTASSRRQAVECLRRTAADAVVVDLRLDDDAGLELVRQIRSEFDGTLVIAVSPRQDGRRAESACDAGAVAVIDKQEVHRRLLPILASHL